MGNIATMARRELGAYFLSPIAYVVIAIFLFTSGLAFGLSSFSPGAEASLRSPLRSVVGHHSGVHPAHADHAPDERGAAQWNHRDADDGPHYGDGGRAG